MKYSADINYQYEFDFIMQYFSHFQYPNLRGIYDNDTKIYCIKKVFSFFFLRLYTLNQYTIFDNPLKEPNYPDNIKDLTIWKEEVEILENNVKELLDNKDLLIQYELPMRNENWIPLEGVPVPLDLISRMKNECDKRIKTLKENPILDNNKIEQFKERTIKIVENYISSIEAVVNGNRQIEESACQKITINGNWISETAAFCDKQEISYVNADEMAGDIINFNLRNLLYDEYFAKIGTKSFKIRDKDIFNIIAKLLNNDSYIVICLGLYLPFYSNLEKGLIYEKDKYSFNGTDIIDISINVPVDERCFCIIKKNELAHINFKGPYNMSVKTNPKNKKKSFVEAYLDVYVMAPKITECIKLIPSYDDSQWDNLNDIVWSFSRPV